MSSVVNMKGQPLPEDLPADEQVERGWRMLFEAMDIIAREADKPGFKDLIISRPNTSWSMIVLATEAFNIIDQIKTRSR